MERSETTPGPASELGTSFAQLTHYAGFDWSKDQHQIAAVDRAGQLLLEPRFEDTAAGWAGLREKLQVFPRIGVAIEACCGPVVERRLDAGLRVYPLNHKAAQRHRGPKAPSGGKSDRVDARSFADALRTDGHAWHRLPPQDMLAQELPLLCRGEIGLIEQRTALVNRLQEALDEL